MRSRVTASRPPALRATARDEGPEANDFFVRASDLCESSSERGTFGDSGAASRVCLPRTFGAVVRLVAAQVDVRSLVYQKPGEAHTPFVYGCNAQTYQGWASLIMSVVHTIGPDEAEPLLSNVPIMLKYSIAHVVRKHSGAARKTPRSCGALSSLGL